MRKSIFLTVNQLYNMWALDVVIVCSYQIRTNEL
jgi:hypothetical protein